jgi:uncharacterized membrane protein YbhN (UPF0104 family)
MPRAGLPHSALVRPRPVRPARGTGNRRTWWSRVKHLLALAFFALVAVLLVRYARGVDWGEVRDSLLGLPRDVLFAAAALAAFSHLLYSCFDLLGRHYTGHTLPLRRVMQVNFISYAVNLNMGSLVGGFAFRYRLYGRLGLKYGTVTRILTLSMLTNWLGYLVLAGAVFAFAPLQLPPHWKLDSEGLRLLGLALLAVAVTYLVLCAFSRRRSWTIRGHEILLPPPRMVLLQLALSCSNWMVMAGAIYVLLQAKVAYTDVLSVLLVAAVAGVITHVPAGLGVLEAVFVALLSHQVSEGRLLGALLGYRALYYIAPLAVAALLYLRVEMHARKKHLRAA